MGSWDPWLGGNMQEGVTAVGSVAPRWHQEDVVGQQQRAAPSGAPALPGGRGRSSVMMGEGGAGTICWLALWQDLSRGTA